MSNTIRPTRMKKLVRRLIDLLIDRDIYISIKYPLACIYIFKLLSSHDETSDCFTLHERYIRQNFLWRVFEYF